MQTIYQQEKMNSHKMLKESDNEIHFDRKKKRKIIKQVLVLSKVIQMCE